MKPTHICAHPLLPRGSICWRTAWRHVCVCKSLTVCVSVHVWMLWEGNHSLYKRHHLCVQCNRNYIQYPLVDFDTTWSRWNCTYRQSWNTKRKKSGIRNKFSKSDIWSTVCESYGNLRFVQQSILWKSGEQQNNCKRQRGLVDDDCN